MAQQSQIIALSQQYIENLDVSHKSILENDLESESSRFFTFTRIHDFDNENKCGIYQIYMNSNKMKYQDHSFAWFRNINIPQIKVKMENYNDNETFSNNNNYQKKQQIHTFYMNSCYIEKNKFVCSGLKGEQFKQDTTQCLFDSLKFERTSHILDPSKSAIFSPFMPAILNRVKVVYQANESPTKNQQLADYPRKDITIHDSIQGFSDYFKRSTIKQKICHPLFLAMKFSRTVNLYYSKELNPSNKELQNQNIQFQADLFINIHQYFIECLQNKNIVEKKIALEIKETDKMNIDEKVRDFLNKIYGQYVILINKKENQKQTLNNFTQLKLKNIDDIKLSYKLAFSQLEMMLLQQQEQEMQKKQLTYYQQNQCPVKNLSSENIYSVPKVEITLNRQFVNPKFAVQVPVQYCSSSFTSSLHCNIDIQKNTRIRNNKSRIPQISSNYTNQSSFSEEEQDIIEQYDSLKKKVKKQSQTQKTYEEILLCSERQLHSEGMQNSEKTLLFQKINIPKLSNDEKDFQRDDQSLFSLLDSPQKKQVQKQEKIQFYRDQQQSLYYESSNYEKNNQFFQKDEYGLKSSECLNQNKGIMITNSQKVQNKQKKTYNKEKYEINTKPAFNQQINQLSQTVKFENLQRQELPQNNTGEYSYLHQSKIKSNHSNIDCMKTDNSNISNLNFQQQQTNNNLNSCDTQATKDQDSSFFNQTSSQFKSFVQNNLSPQKSNNLSSSPLQSQYFQQYYQQMPFHTHYNSLHPQLMQAYLQQPQYQLVQVVTPTQNQMSNYQPIIYQYLPNKTQQTNHPSN